MSVRSGKARRPFWKRLQGVRSLIGSLGCRNATWQWAVQQQQLVLVVANRGDEMLSF
jgi:hypothetical protein